MGPEAAKPLTQNPNRAPRRFIWSCALPTEISSQQSRQLNPDRYERAAADLCRLMGNGSEAREAIDSLFFFFSLTVARHQQERNSDRILAKHETLQVLLNAARHGFCGGFDRAQAAKAGA